MPSDWVVLDSLTVGSSSSSGIYIGQLFSTKEWLYTELSIVAIRDKFEFKVDRSTNIRWEACCAVKTCKWRLRATRANNKENVQWLVKRYDMCKGGIPLGRILMPLTMYNIFANGGCANRGCDGEIVMMGL
ncbi:hypothetical protein WN943_004567 [Citrus x changshan-huyou]